MPIFGTQVLGADGPPGAREGRAGRHLAGRQRHARGRAPPTRTASRGMLIEMPVLDNALLGCAIAFTPLLLSLTFGAPVARTVGRGLSLVPRRGPLLGQMLLDWASQDPKPSASVLQGLFFGRTAPPRRSAGTLEPPALVIGHPRDPDPSVLRLRHARERAAQRAADRGVVDPRAAHLARAPDRARSWSSSTTAGAGEPGRSHGAGPPRARASNGCGPPERAAGPLSDPLSAGHYSSPPMASRKEQKETAAPRARGARGGRQGGQRSASGWWATARAALVLAVIVVLVRGARRAAADGDGKRRPRQRRAARRRRACPTRR